MFSFLFSLLKKLFIQPPKVVLLIGGFGRLASDYTKLVQTTPSKFQVKVLAVSEITSGSLDEAGENILKFLNQEKLQKVILAGHSLGGVIALDFCYRYPQRVEKLILANSEGIPGHESLPQLIQNFFKTGRARLESDLRQDLGMSLEIFKNPLKSLQLAKQAYSTDLQEEAKKIKVATVLLWGDQDYLTPLWQGEALNWLIPKSKLIVLKGFDHDWPIHSPQPFWDVVQ